MVVLGSAERVRAVVPETAEVLSGAGRHRADADADAANDRESLDNTLVVASTFAFAVVQRRPGRQVRRMVRAEALLVGCLASALGGASGLLGTRPLTGRSSRWTSHRPGSLWRSPRARECSRRSGPPS
ncbi:hypothetical protein [Streptomyces sp. NPDC127039]|uniref:hypothetical protein n=1 Tax=Streptomyces sp. NPDC127039 TaxID=3347115 RepID=UPI0036655D62